MGHPVLDSQSSIMEMIFSLLAGSCTHSPAPYKHCAQTIWHPSSRSSMAMPQMVSTASESVRCTRRYPFSPGDAGRCSMIRILAKLYTCSATPNCGGWIQMGRNTSPGRSCGAGSGRNFSPRNPRQRSRLASSASPASPRRRTTSGARIAAALSDPGSSMAQ
jgi:hypothetical protein